MKKIAISNFIKGCGKTTIVTLLANSFHYHMEKNVLVVDASNAPDSITFLRERERLVVETDETYRKKRSKQLQTSHKKDFPILSCKPYELVNRVDEYVENSKLPIDLIIYDLGENIQLKGIVNTLMTLDYLFIPVTMEKETMHSGFSLARAMEEMKNIYPPCHIKQVYLFWNMVTKLNAT
ncbi:MAG: hypothetical protein LIO65_02105 [Odoribacter sp.]|nr:hypothetical protein [Odoribacter sp.]